MLGQVIALVVLVLGTAALGVWWSARQGAVRAPREVPAGIDWSSAGITLAERVTFVQFSAEVCAACRSTARVLGGLTGSSSGVGHRELLVDDHLDLVRKLGVLRTPTVLVVDGGGREVARMSGVVSDTQARQALNRVPLTAGAEADGEGQS
ncbi:thioredoxin family protein [Promicromonospora iranensis]|jgi:thiol-disulfide isomerase/thioredoxin|uniref:thioredoxin family protein n=1 Tax=Promicromonospora iranensis TaxID=1105144 RepID=UPI0023A9445B|nr:thioredoxin family protein [Promicromonospora iranensis]